MNSQVLSLSDASVTMHAAAMTVLPHYAASSSPGAQECCMRRLQHATGITRG